jgi:hypothetical protein
MVQEVQLTLTDIGNSIPTLTKNLKHQQLQLQLEQQMMKFMLLW